MIRNKFITGTGITIIALFIGYFIGNVVPVTTTVSSPNMDTSAIILNNDRMIERELIRMDIEVVGKQIGLSSWMQTEYVQCIDSASLKYKLPGILLHAIVFVESGYNPEATHAQITVKGKKTHAIGLAGIVWEYHSDNLIGEGIAESRLDLFKPSINLMASAYILHKYITDIIKENPKIAENRLFDELIKRYYGAYDNSYKERMYAKIKETASKQWIHRVVQNIFTEFKPKTHIILEVAQ